MHLVLFLAVAYLITFALGILLEKIRIPWIFAALILGMVFAWRNPFPHATSSPTFEFLAELGMYFMLFLIGFEIDLKELVSKGKFIVKGAFFIILLEGFLGTLLLHFAFGYGWFISGIVALSFATVGEAMLLPILDEFNLIKTDLGQTIIGIGTLDDAIEIFVIILVSILLGTTVGKGHFNILVAFGSLAFLFAGAYGLTRLSEESKKLKVLGIEGLFLFVMFVFFLFLAVGRYAEASALGALVAGIALKNFVPEKRLKPIETDLKSVAYGLFGPLFFLWVGIDTSISYLISYPLMVLLIVLTVKSAKLGGSWIVGRNKLGTKKSVLLGISLCVKFSTSIVIIKLLFEAGLIQVGLYSALIAAKIIFKFLVPFLLSHLIDRWDISPSEIGTPEGG